MRLGWSSLQDPEHMIAALDSVFYRPPSSIFTPMAIDGCSAPDSTREWCDMMAVSYRLCDGKHACTLAWGWTPPHIKHDMVEVDDGVWEAACPYRMQAWRYGPAIRLDVKHGRPPRFRGWTRMKPFLEDSVRIASRTDTLHGAAADVFLHQRWDRVDDMMPEAYRVRGLDGQNGWRQHSLYELAEWIHDRMRVKRPWRESDGRREGGHRGASEGLDAHRRPGRSVLESVRP